MTNQGDKLDKDHIEPTEVYDLIWRHLPIAKSMPT